MARSSSNWSGQHYREAAYGTRGDKLAPTGKSDKPRLYFASVLKNLGHDDKVSPAMRIVGVAVRLSIVEPILIVEQIAELVGATLLKLDTQAPSARAISVERVARTLPIVEIADEVDSIGPEIIRQRKSHLYL